MERKEGFGVSWDAQIGHAWEGGPRGACLEEEAIWDKPDCWRLSFCRSQACSTAVQKDGMINTFFVCVVFFFWRHASLVLKMWHTLPFKNPIRWILLASFYWEGKLVSYSLKLKLTQFLIVKWCRLFVKPVSQRCIGNWRHIWVDFSGESQSISITSVSSMYCIGSCWNFQRRIGLKLRFPSKWGYSPS